MERPGAERLPAERDETLPDEACPLEPEGAPLRETPPQLAGLQVSARLEQQRLEQTGQVELPQVALALQPELLASIPPVAERQPVPASQQQVRQEQQVKRVERPAALALAPALEVVEVLAVRGASASQRSPLPLLRPSRLPPSQPQPAPRWPGPGSAYGPFRQPQHQSNSNGFSSR